MIMEGGAVARGGEDARGRASEREEDRVAALARAVRERREALGLRQSELADLAGCSQRFVHTVENGKASLRLDKVLDLFEVLGLAMLVVPGPGRVRLEPGLAAGPASRGNAVS